MPREAALGIVCPACAADTGEPCFDLNAPGARLPSSDAHEARRERKARLDAEYAALKWHPCARCGEETLNDRYCRDCGLDEAFAQGSCRECLTWLIDPASPVVNPGAVPPVREQHKPGCSLRDVDDCGPLDDADVRRIMDAR